MNGTNSQTIEQVLFERMGMSVEDAVATGADVVDEKISNAVRSGIDVDARMAGLGALLEKLSDPKTVSALGQLLDSLPQLARLAKLAHEMPNILATLGDVLDDYQQRCAADGIDVERSLTNGFQAALWLGSKIDNDHLRRIGDLLDSDILNSDAVSVVNNAARSLTQAQQQTSDSPAKNRIGMLGLLAALRNPEIQRSLAFAAEFGKCFGKNLDANQP
jgi:uncharacterized protein YjgD (DUF1641 family)